MNKVTDRSIYRLDFYVTASVLPDGKAKRVTQKGILADMKKLKKVKFEKIDCPYADWIDCVVSKSDKGKWCIEFTLDCEHTSHDGAQALLRAYYLVFSQGIGMLNGTGFFKYKYEFNKNDFEEITIKMGYLQSDAKTVYFPN